MYWEDCELFGGTSFIFYCHIFPLGIQMALSFCWPFYSFIFLFSFFILILRICEFEDVATCKQIHICTGFSVAK